MIQPTSPTYTNSGQPQIPSYGTHHRNIFNPQDWLSNSYVNVSRTNQGFNASLASRPTQIPDVVSYQHQQFPQPVIIAGQGTGLVSK